MNNLYCEFGESALRNIVSHEVSSFADWWGVQVIILKSQAAAAFTPLLY